VHGFGLDGGDDACAGDDHGEQSADGGERAEHRGPDDVQGGRVEDEACEACGRFVGDGVRCSSCLLLGDAQDRASGDQAAERVAADDARERGGSGARRVGEPLARDVRDEVDKVVDQVVEAVHVDAAVGLVRLGASVAVAVVAVDGERVVLRPVREDCFCLCGGWRLFRRERREEGVRVRVSGGRARAC
jgi:hypothetical protein